MAGFTGFPIECIEFFKGLEKNNDKRWFEQHKEEYEKYVQMPSRYFVVDLGKKLEKIAPNIIADPRVNRSLFKIHRDTRFSPDKRPFKTNLGIWLWEGELKRMECSGFYFHFEGDKIIIAAGLYMFPKEHLAEYRDSVVHDRYGAELVKAIKNITKDKHYKIGGKSLKKVPRGLDPEHPNAEWLLYGGIFASIAMKIPKEFYSSKLIDLCYQHFKAMLPLHRWVVAMVERV
ncbi:MAG: DUF2461 domain-containing protein [Candidatus Zixiibacteriota bacterium]|nr:MAG: DUF2461 domain-containing protein [candidate division Zixibacteria bacterium]